jgi:hypothetical protein
MHHVADEFESGVTNRLNDDGKGRLEPRLRRNRAGGVTRLVARHRTHHGYLNAAARGINSPGDRYVCAPETWAARSSTADDHDH